MSKTEHTPLKPCPFCGCSNVAQGASRDRVSAWCIRCGARGPDVPFPENCDPGPPIDECHEKWNRRPVHDEMLAALKAMLSNPDKASREQARTAISRATGQAGEG